MSAATFVQNVQFGAKDVSFFKVPGQEYDFVCYFLDFNGVIIPGQKFSKIVNGDKKVLLFGTLPSDVTCYINTFIVGMIQSKGFVISYMGANILSNKLGIVNLRDRLGEIFNDPVTPVVVLSSPDYKWGVIPAATWTEIPAGTKSIKVIPNGEVIKFRYDDFLYRAFSDDDLKRISKIQSKPYAHISIGNYQSVFIRSDKEFHYKYAAEVKSDFCLRECMQYQQGFVFQVKNPIAVYSKIEGKILTSEDTTITPSKTTVDDLYHYDLAGFQSKQYNFIRSDESNAGIALIIERRV